MWATIQAWSSYGIGFVCTIYIARLLGPEPIGLFALASILFVFLQSFVNDVFFRIAIQCRTLEPEALDAIFWGSAFISLICVIANIALANCLGRWFAQPLIGPVMSLLAANFLLNGLSSVPQIILQRNFNFKRLALASLTAVSLGGSTGVLTALFGFGVWSIVIQQLATGLFFLILVWISCPWRPRLKFSFTYFREIVGFEGNIIGSKLCDSLGGRVSDLLIGRFLGVPALGYYSMGGKFLFTMTQAVGGPVYRTMFAYFSRLRDENGDLAAALYDVTHVAVFFMVPIFVGSIILAPDFVRCALGYNWEAAISVIQIFMIAGIADFACMSWRIIMIVLGKPSWDFKITFLNTIVSIIACFLALYWGVLGVTIAAVATFYLFMPFRFLLIHKLIRMKASSYIRQYVEPAIGSAAMVFAICLARQYAKNISIEALPTFALCGAAGVVTYFLIVSAIAPQMFQRLLLLARSAFGIK